MFAANVGLPAILLVLALVALAVYAVSYLAGRGASAGARRGRRQ